eukprot:TRINITY_DN30937_c0_g1_i1.p1 TRINITY_DN30937_c0_g1~~TRINITY_DN30937_c0_g1_i1.p1  ORF type:complete len:337 (+),score=42.46 TRINITY_DN30937_c0_g1_i1:67-1077(+)
MKSLTTVLGTIIALSLFPGAATDDGNPMAVLGYLPEWRYLQWPEFEQKYRWKALGKHVTHLIIFSIEVGANGDFAAMDRFPPKHILQRAHEARSETGMKLMICFGGNSRTNGFPQVVKTKKSRAVFLKNLKKLLTDYSLDGVDYNWEYPKTESDWRGLSDLIKETRTELDPQTVITMAYYPDGKQEEIIEKTNIHKHVDYMNIMSYDQPGKHSTFEFGKRSVDGGVAKLPASKLAMGLPFYARNVETGDWTTYEDLWNQRGPLRPTRNAVGKNYFNGREMIKKKVRYAQDMNLGALMIWEVGQDAFSNPDSDLNQEGSLLVAISEVRRETRQEPEL